MIEQAVATVSSSIMTFAFTLMHFCGSLARIHQEAAAQFCRYMSLRAIDPDKETECACRTNFPSLLHILHDLMDMLPHLLVNLRYIVMCLTFSLYASSQIYPGDFFYNHLGILDIQRWPKHDEVPITFSYCSQFVHEQWPHHFEAVRNAAFTWSETIRIQKLLTKPRYITKIINRTI